MTNERFRDLPCDVKGSSLNRSNWIETIPTRRTVLIKYVLKTSTFLGPFTDTNPASTLSKAQETGIHRWTFAVCDMDGNREFELCAGVSLVLCIYN